MANNAAPHPSTDEMPTPNTVLPLQVTNAINQAIADAVAYLPTVVAALVILLVGYIVGRLLGGVVTRLIRRIGMDRYTEGTAIEGMGSGDAVANGLGKVVSYYVYFVAVLAAADVLNIPQLTELLAMLGGYLPVILGGLVVLLVGFVVGRILGDIVADLVGGVDVAPFLQETPLERLSDTEGELGRLAGQLVTYYVYFLTLLAVADILRITALSSLLNAFAGYIPAFVGGLLVLLVGIWVAERVGGLVREASGSGVGRVAALLVKVLIYYLTITVALSTIGFDVAVLTNLFTTFVVAFLGALALALAVGIGLAVGFGGQDYVAENIDGWVASARGTVTAEPDETDRTDTGDTE